jgi:hypothetical protein
MEIVHFTSDVYFRLVSVTAVRIIQACSIKIMLTLACLSTGSPYVVCYPLNEMSAVFSPTFQI